MFNKEKFEGLPRKFRKRAEVCCETVNGLCYMLALDIGVFKRMINIRSLQFTTYMDVALEGKGFPEQSYAQKKKILEVMELAIDGWDKVTKD